MSESTEATASVQDVRQHPDLQELLDIIDLVGDGNWYYPRLVCELKRKIEAYEQPLDPFYEMTLEVLISLTGEMWPGYIKSEPKRAPASRRARKPSATAELKAAKRAGATAATLSSGTRVSFGGESTVDDASKAWDEAAAAKRRSADAKPH